MSELDVTTQEYRDLPSIPNGRYGHGCAVVTVNDRRYLVVAGGTLVFPVARATAGTDILDLVDETWVSGGEMSQVRTMTQMVVVNDRVVVLGGQGEDSSPVDTVEELDMENWTWSLVDVRMKQPRSGFEAVVIPKKMVSP